MRVAAVLGRPGTGKTSLVRAWMGLADDWEQVEPARLVRAHYSPSRDVHVLGTYEPGEVFAGTDRLSMACQPQVLGWMCARRPAAVLLEGDRLANTGFFDTLLANGARLGILVLGAPELELLARYAERGSSQSEQFLKGRATKVARIGRRYLGSAARVRSLDHVRPADTVAAMRWVDDALA